MHPSTEKTSIIKEQLKKETDAWNNKPRFGLFSYAANHGFGFRDDPNKPNRRDETGHVRTAPKNFMGGRPRSANVRLDSFTQTGYLSQNDEYVDPTSIMKYRDTNSKNMKKVHNQAFKPSADLPSRLRAPYEYISDPLQPNKTGVVPKNFVTTGLKKGYGNTTYGHLFSQPRYDTDPFDNPKMLDSIERREHSNKVRSGPFFTTFQKRDHFTSNIRLYRDPPGMHRGPSKKTTSISMLKPFLRTDLPRNGYNCTINKFPEYVEQPPQDPPLSQSPKEGKWRSTYKELSLPTPSVQHYNAINRPKRKY